jgi:hypothetical protein
MITHLDKTRNQLDEIGDRAGVWDGLKNVIAN